MQKQLMVVVLCVCATLLACPSPSSAQVGGADTGTILGVVKDSDREPLPGANVVLTGRSMEKA